MTNISELYTLEKKRTYSKRDVSLHLKKKYLLDSDEIRKNITSSNSREIEDAIKEKNIIFISDFHSSFESINFIQNTIKREKNITILFECFPKSLNYLFHSTKEKLSYLRTLPLLNYWPFPLSGHISLMEQFPHFNFIGINPIKRLTFKQRELFFLDEIKKTIATHQNHKIIILIGEYHLFSKIIREKMNKENVLYIHLNSPENIFPENNNAILKNDKNDFFLQTAPLYFKYLLYNTWEDFLEENNNNEKSLFDISIFLNSDFFSHLYEKIKSIEDKNILTKKQLIKKIIKQKNLIYDTFFHNS